MAVVRVRISKQLGNLDPIMKIGIVDDSSFARDRLKSCLNRFFPDASFVECGDGKVALKRLPGEEVDFITLDIVMPKLNGIWVLKHLREFDFQAPIVILTADIQEGTQTICRELGCCGFVEKPISEEKIESMLVDLGL